MRKWTLTLSGVFLIMIFSVLVNCNLGSPDYTLIVEVGAGVVGFPEAGTYEHKEFTEIEYYYESIQGGTPPEVILSETRLGPEGTIMIYADVVLTVRQIDIRKNWEISLLVGETNAEMNKYVITFSGDNNLSGTFVDDNGRGGTWQTDGNQLTIAYSNWIDYQFSGSVSSMTGTWIGEGREGTWSAQEVVDN